LPDLHNNRKTTSLEKLNWRSLREKEEEDVGSGIK
jgi:hypothetical protein